MNLIASLICRNELSRYLEVSIASMLTYCDEIRVLDDSSEDGSYEWLLEQERVMVMGNRGQGFFEHEGRARQELLEWTLEGRPTHILAIDADEFVADGEQLRTAPNSRTGVWTLVMEEIWKADEEELRIRMDGGWRAHPISCVYSTQRPTGRMRDSALACGREPDGVRRRGSRAVDSGTEILHFGWTNESERARRYERYAIHDGGKFHRNEHLESILWPDEKVRLEASEWPSGLESLKTEILSRTRATRPTPAV